MEQEFRSQNDLLTLDKWTKSGLGQQRRNTPAIIMGLFSSKTNVKKKVIKKPPTMRPPAIIVEDEHGNVSSTSTYIGTNSDMSTSTDLEANSVTTTHSVQQESSHVPVQYHKKTSRVRDVFREIFGLLRRCCCCCCRPKIEPE